MRLKARHQAFTGRRSQSLQVDGHGCQDRGREHPASRRPDIVAYGRPKRFQELRPLVGKAGIHFGDPEDRLVDRIQSSDGVNAFTDCAKLRRDRRRGRLIQERCVAHFGIVEAVPLDLSQKGIDSAVLIGRDVVLLLNCLRPSTEIVGLWSDPPRS